MFRSYWLIFITVVGLGYPINDGPYAQERPADARKQQLKQDPVDLVPLQHAINRITRAIEALKENPDSEVEQKRAEDDLGAQKEMALWAFWMFIAASVGVALTAAGIILIWRTLVHTARAAVHTEGMLREAEKTTSAANAAIATANESSERQLRAYVQAQAPTIIDFTVGKAPLIKYWASNTGQTPARRFRHKTGWCFVEDPDTFPVRGIFPFNLKGSVIEIGGGDRSQQYTFLPTVRQDIFDAVRNGGKCILFFGVISYRDIFGRNRRSVFRYCLRQGAVLEGPIGAPLISNLAACKKNNRSN